MVAKEKSELKSLQYSEDGEAIALGEGFQKKSFSGFKVPGLDTVI